MKTAHLFAAVSLVLPGAAFSTPAFATSQDDAATTYRTVLALMDEMVANGLITRTKADALIAKARENGEDSAANTVTTPAPATIASAEPVPVAQTPGHDGPPAKAVTTGKSLGVQPAVPADLKVDWSRGAPTFAARDGKFTFKPRGRILADVYTTGGSRFDQRNITTSSLRQFRFGALGSAGDHLFYQFEADFRRNQTEVNNTFVGYRTKFGTIEADVRAGSLLTDRGIDVATAAQANPFIMLNINSLALAPQNAIFVMGLAGRASGPNWHTSIAIHGDRVDGDYGRSDNRVLMARAHWNPLLDDQGAIHLGGWAYDEAMPGVDATQTVTALVDGALSSNVRVTSGTLTGVDGSRAFGAEIGAFRGPFFLYGEYGERHLRKGPTATFDKAAYKALSIIGGWWVTGEKVPYQARSGTFVAPNVAHPLMGDGGTGALELVGRYERVDFSEVPLGGIGSTITLGLNWHMTNYFRLMANYAYWRTVNIAGTDAGRDTGSTLAMRAEVSF